MNIEQIYTKCLAQGAYFIENSGEAAVIDPIRETDSYIAMAAASGSKIKYIFETHFHADFVSGHLDLAAKTGAQIIFGPGAKTKYDAYNAVNNETFAIGNLTLKLLHTPGHTLESSCYLLQDEAKKDIAIFTGDTLFIGDVGRPDLAQQFNGELTQHQLAGMLFDSLREKIMPLADDIMVYPAHGAGSACGKNLSKETFDTLGNQKKTNYALRPDMTKEEFINEVTFGLSAPPSYFPMNVRLNSEGYEKLDSVLSKGLKPLSPKEFKSLMSKHDTMVLDTRKPQDFGQCFIPGSVNIGLDGSFAPWVGALLPFTDVKILIVADAGREEETVSRLSRIGFDSAIGFLDGGIDAWKANGGAVKNVVSMSADTFLKYREMSKLNVIDVRNHKEFEGGHLDGAIHLPLDDINKGVTNLATDKTYYVYCAGGYRSMIFISMLKSKSDLQLVNINGGYGLIESALNKV